MSVSFHDCDRSPRMPHVRSASIALVALWAALLLVGGAAPKGQAPTPALDVASKVATVHVTTGTVALSAHAEGPPATADGQPPGETEGEEFDGRGSTVVSSSPRLVVSDERAVVRGRRTSRPPSCPVLCVFRC